MTVFVADEQAEVAVDLPRLRRLAQHVCADRGVPDAMEVSVLCVDAEAITALNRTHMGSDRPTDVLAFPLDQPGETTPGDVAILGDVVLCPAVAAAQAPEHGKTAQAEMDLLVVHGLLHLLGHDHAEEGERAHMFGLTDDLLASFDAVEGAGR
ncbi:rRNA maturation RNase YbeY [Euzebya sp.]|uniref:rRNA maturation RNase YbeY n=1 Tax=Euzebya sp. TaxID=1971409 RepID=UPI003510E213